ncbi:MAG: type II CAAX endopeptidase family protein [Phycisphaerae bacterium]
MGYPSSHGSNTNLPPTTESVQFAGRRFNSLNIPLLTEIVLVTIVTILAIRFFGNGFLFTDAWFVAPGILIAAAIVPTAIKKRKFSEIGFNIKQIRNSLVVLGWTCMVVFPATFFGCWLLKSYGLNLPLRPMLPEGQNLVGWLFYQFMYVAVAEEIFFRGYVQSNILKLISTAKLEQYRLRQLISITLSAICFAAAHIIIQGHMISVLVFLPGLILGWLFIRTKSLLAPILFHGLANTCYFLMAAALA